jgi:hypothetical protein
MTAAFSKATKAFVLSKGSLVVGVAFSICDSKFLLNPPQGKRGNRFLTGV